MGNLVYLLDSVTKRKYVIDEFTVPILSSMSVKSFGFKLQVELNVHYIPQIFITNLQHRIVDNEVKSYFSILQPYYLTEDNLEVLTLLTSSSKCCCYRHDPLSLVYMIMNIEPRTLSTQRSTLPMSSISSLIFQYISPIY